VPRKGRWSCFLLATTSSCLLAKTKKKQKCSWDWRSKRRLTRVLALSSSALTCACLIDLTAPETQFLRERYCTIGEKLSASANQWCNQSSPYWMRLPRSEDRMSRQPLQVLVQGHLAHLYKVLLLHDLRPGRKHGCVRLSSIRIDGWAHNPCKARLESPVTFLSAYSTDARVQVVHVYTQSKKR
jgi:hypothetical protein